MNAQDLRNLLEKTDNKLDVFSNMETLRQYSFNIGELFDLITDFLTDKEKQELLNYPYIQRQDIGVKLGIVGLISDSSIKTDIFVNDSMTDELSNYQVADFIKKLDDESKTTILYNQEFIEKHGLDKYMINDIITSSGDKLKLDIIYNPEFIEKNQIDSYSIRGIISSLNDNIKIDIVNNKDLTLKKLKLSEYDITSIVQEINNEQDKDKIIDTYKDEGFYSFKLNVISTYSNSSKLKKVLEEKDFNNSQRLTILSSLDIETLSKFFKENRNFCEENEILPCKVVRKFDSTKQKEFIEVLEEFDFSLNEKKEIFATLSDETKQNIDISKLPEEYRIALSIESKYGYVKLDFDRNLEDYKGLDRLMEVEADKYTDEQKSKFMQLCEICPDLVVVNKLNDAFACYSTVEEYKEAEKWIEELISSLNPEYSDLQKIAIIDNAIGKKVSYSPDFDTEVYNVHDSRALWKIVSSGYGVCNGISNLEKYIFDKIGIDSEIVSSGSHAFLKLKNIEIPLETGEIQKGNTILDPTWNLTSQRFEGRPNNFCVSYEEIRKHDIDGNNIDHNCHTNDEKLQDATLISSGLIPRRLRRNKLGKHYEVLFAGANTPLSKRGKHLF